MGVSISHSKESAGHLHLHLSPPPCSALHDTRSKLLADVFYGSPGSTSLVENVQNENYELEQIDMRGGYVDRVWCCHSVV